MLVKQTLKPIYNKNTKILLLGSIPSKISRDKNFYYANKCNRFWLIFSNLFNINFNNDKEKINFLLNNNIGLYDIIKECEIIGSSDSSIRNVKVINLKNILNNSNIKYIFCIGKVSYNLYKKYFKNFNIKCYYLPSPSSANASYSLDNLIKEYSIIKEKLN